MDGVLAGGELRGEKGVKRERERQIVCSEPKKKKKKTKQRKCTRQDTQDKQGHGWMSRN